MGKPVSPQPRQPARSQPQHTNKPAAGAARIERLAAYAGVPVLWFAVAGPVFSLPVFKRGLWELAEPLVIAHFAASGLAALLLAAWLAGGGRFSRPALLLALPAFALAVWLLVSGPGGFVAAEWRLRLLGVPQSGLGPLWYAGFGLWLLLGDLVLRHALAWRLVLWGGFAASAVILVVLGIDRINNSVSSLFHVLAYYAWPGLALPAIAWALPIRDRLALVERLLAILIALGLLVLGKAISMMAGAGAGLVIALLWWRLPQDGLPGLLRKPVVVAALVATAALLPLLLVSLPEVTANFDSLESRRKVWLMIWSVPAHEPLAWLVGNGAGSMPSTMLTQLAFSEHPLWKIDEWDMLKSRYFHAHNWLLQALHDGGLPAVLLLAWLLIQPVWLAPAARRGMALGLVVAYLLALGLWFELIFALPYLALAWIGIMQPAQPGVAGATAMRHAAIAALFVFAGVFFWAAVGLERYARQIDQQLAWFSNTPDIERPPLGPPPALPTDPRDADMQLADMLSYQIQGVISRQEEAHVPPYPEREVQRIEWILQILRTRLPDTRSPLFLLHGERIFSDLMLRPSMAAYHPLLLPHLSLWRQIIERSLQLAPHRSDMAQGYLNWTLQSGRRSETLSLARLIRQAKAEDPIGLFFEGAVLTLEDNAAHKSQGMALLRRSLAAGVEQFFPVDASFKRNIGAL